VRWLRPGSQANPARARYITHETIADVLDACPSLDWKLVVALARHAGLRCPTEIGELNWADVNWEKGRLMVRSKKTEHHGGDHAVRVVPICPELRALMADAFEKAEPGAALIVPMANRKGVNLRTQRERIIAKAGHQVWPRLATPGRGRRATRIATPLRRELRLRTRPHRAARSRTKRQNPLQPQGLQRDLRKLRRLSRTGTRQDAAGHAKKAALAMDGSAAVKWRGQDSNLRPRGYEPRELPGCSTPRHGCSDGGHSPRDAT
jgi:integrase